MPRNHVSIDHLPHLWLYVLSSFTVSNDTCIFDSRSPLYTANIRDSFLSVDNLVSSCEDLDEFWRHLIVIMSLSIVGLLVSLLAIISDCVTPCMWKRNMKRPDQDQEWIIINNLLATCSYDFFKWDQSSVIVPSTEPPTWGIGHKKSRKV